MAYLNKNLEIGSEFHWTGVPCGPFLSWPEPYRLFASGREALLSLWRVLQGDNINILYVPDYFCGEVATWWEQKGITIRHYSDGPSMTSPAWETLTATHGEAVLAVNYFGVRDGAVWEEWSHRNKGVVLIEDHSHDPLSGWVSDSKADYAFASLRKTFPVPDGAILWSPKGLSLPDEPLNNDWTGSALKLAAMILKKGYIDGDSGENVKDIYRGFQIKGEAMIGNTHEASVSPWSRFLLSSGYPIAWRKQRELNVKTFLDLIAAHPKIQPLFTDWPDNHCPYNAVMLFICKEDRDSYRARLIKAGVFPSVHWDMRSSSSPDVLALSNRIMTIPVDQRYGEDDMKVIASILLSKS